MPQVLAASGINGTSVRLGQIAGGAENGAWATSDWVPILVKSSIGLGALPSAQGVSLKYQNLIGAESHLFYP